MTIKPLGTLFKGWFGSYTLETNKEEIEALAGNDVFGTTVYSIEAVGQLQQELLALKLQKVELESEVAILNRELALFKQYKQAHDLCPMRSDK